MLQVYMQPSQHYLRHTVVAFSEIFEIYFLVFHHKHQIWICVHEDLYTVTE